MPSFKGAVGGPVLRDQKNNEILAATAAREFVEESLEVVLSRQEVNTIIAEKSYARRIVLQIIHDRRPKRYHCTYVIRVPWDPMIPLKFRDTRRRIEQIDRLTQYWKHIMPRVLQNVSPIGAIWAREDGHVVVRSERLGTPCVLPSACKVETDGNCVLICVSGDHAEARHYWNGRLYAKTGD